MELNKELLDSLTDEEFCYIFGKKFNEFLDEQKDEDYEINRPQWLKFIKVLKFFCDLTAKTNGRVERCEVRPREQHGGVTAYFTVLDIRANDIPAFCETLSLTSAITVDATEDGNICISVSVPYVFVKKS